MKSEKCVAHDDDGFTTFDRDIRNSFDSAHDICALATIFAKTLRGPRYIFDCFIWVRYASRRKTPYLPDWSLETTNFSFLEDT